MCSKTGTYDLSWVLDALVHNGKSPVPILDVMLIDHMKKNDQEHVILYTSLQDNVCTYTLGWDQVRSHFKSQVKSMDGKMCWLMLQNR